MRITATLFILHRNFMSESLKNWESFGDKANNYYNANFMLNIKSKYGENSINLISIKLWSNAAYGCSFVQF